jgi:ubiquinone/menaquinone biosynthesis C-methylase UbiE
MGLYSEIIFPWLLDRALGHPNIMRRRQALVRGARGEALEIGFGSGATLPFYDPAKVTSLTVVEPSEGMNRRAAAHLAQSPVPVRSVPGAGERLPFPDASFDTVVCCLTLCSVQDVGKVLAEVSCNLGEPMVGIYNASSYAHDLDNAANQQFVA